MGNKVSSAEERVSERFIAEVWQDISMPKAQGRIAVVHHQSSTYIKYHKGSHQVIYEYETNYAVKGFGKEAESLIEAYFSEYMNFDRPITDESKELLLVAQFLQVFEPLDGAALGKKSYSNRCLIQLDNMFADAKIEYDQWKRQQETSGCQATVPERSEIEQLKMEVKECKDKIRELTVRLDQQQKEVKECKDKIRELTVRLDQQQVDVEDCEFQVRQLMKNLDAQKEKMDGGKTNWSDLALFIAEVLGFAISIAVHFFCPHLARIWSDMIEIARKIVPWLLCKILPMMWNWVKDFLKKLCQKIKSSKS